MKKFIAGSLVVYLVGATLLFYILSKSDQQVVVQGLFYQHKTHVLAGPISSLFIWPPLICGFSLTLIGIFIPASKYGVRKRDKWIAVLLFLLMFATGILVRQDAQYFLGKMQDRQSERVIEFSKKIKIGEYTANALTIADKNSINYKFKKLKDYRLKLEYSEIQEEIAVVEFFMPYSQNSLIVTLTDSVDKDGVIVRKYCYFSHEKAPSMFVAFEGPNGAKGFTGNPAWKRYNKKEYQCE